MDYAQTTLPYVTAALPGTGGALKRTAAHFCVTELPAYLPDGNAEGKFLYLELERQGQSTRQVSEAVAQAFAVSREDIGTAGQKDTVATVRQWFSVRLESKAARTGWEERLAALRGLYTVHQAAWHGNKLKTGHLRGNRFAVVISDVGPEALSRAQAVVEQLRATGVPNYYGPQRFAQDNLARAVGLLRGERKVRDPWQARFLTSVFQSHVCNLYLARRVEAGLFGQILIGDLCTKLASGGMFDCVEAATDQPRYLSGEISYTAPMPGRAMRAPAPGTAAAEFEDSVLQPCAEDIARIRADGTRRAGCLRPAELAVQAHPEGLSVTLELPRGSYATVVLREIMKNDAALAESED